MTVEVLDLDRFKSIPITRRDRCVVCETKMSDAVLELPDFPLTEIYVDKKPTEKLGFVDQEFCLCERCGHGQVTNVVEPEFVYQSSYETRTSSSSSGSAAMDVFIEFIDDVLKDRPIQTIVEIGCNDLYLLRRLKARAQRLYGIDPIWIGKDPFEDEKITTIGGFAESVDLRREGVKLDVVLCSHTLEHISEPRKMVHELIAQASEESLFLFQFPGLESLVQDSRFDQVFHQHLNYFSLRSVLRMLDDCGANLIHAAINPYHWGTLMVAFKKRGRGQPKEHRLKAAPIELTRQKIVEQYAVFRDCMSVTTQRLRALKHERIYGFGAALMLPVLDYHLGDGLTGLIGVIDQDDSKVGKYYLNVPIPVVHPNEVENIKDCIVMSTAINSLDAGRKIIPKLMQLNVKQIIVPLNTI